MFCFAHSKIFSSITGDETDSTIKLIYHWTRLDLLSVCSYWGENIYLVVTTYMAMSPAKIQYSINDVLPISSKCFTMEYWWVLFFSNSYFVTKRLLFTYKVVWLKMNLIVFYNEFLKKYFDTHSISYMKCWNITLI